MLGKAGIWGRGKLGKSALTYILQSGAALAQYKPLEMQVRVDGCEFYSGKVFSGFVLNGRYNAGGVDWAHATRIDDGVFHVVIQEPRNPVATALSAPCMLSGDWSGVKGIHTTTGKRVEVSCVAKRLAPLFEIDGDQPEELVAAGEERTTLTVDAGAIRMFR